VAHCDSAVCAPHHTTTEELEAIKKKYATKGQIFETPDLIADNPRDMLRHCVTHILPNGLKAQVVAPTAGWRWCATWMPLSLHVTSCWRRPRR
jgi:hypothetical protein